MSDSEWESDDDDSTAAATPTATAPSPSQPAASPSNGGVVPNVLFALPIQLALKEVPALAGGIPAGITILFDAAKNSMTLLAYDAHKRPMLLEPLDAARLSKPTLPFNIAPVEGASQSLSLSDAQGRKWTLTFSNESEAYRMQAAVAVATLVARAAANTPYNQIYLKHDLSKGTGKSCKSKQYVSGDVRAWLVEICTDPTQKFVSALGKFSPDTTFTQFQPDFNNNTPTASPITTPILNSTFSEVEVPDESASSVLSPVSLSECLAGGKLKTEGGSRIIVVPATSELAKEILNGAAVKREGEGSFLVVQLVPKSVSKKREKKEKEKKEKKKSSSTADEVNTAAAADDTADADDTEAASSSSSSSSVSAPVVPSADVVAWSTELSSTLQPLMTHLQAMNEQVTSTAQMQHKILKFLSAELYDNLVTDLGLTAAAEAQAAASASAEAGSEAPPAVDATQAAQLQSLQTRVRSIVSGFVEKNSVDHKGTLATVVSTWKAQLLPAIQPLVAPGPNGLLSEQKIKSVIASGGGGNGGSSAGGADSEKLKKIQSQHASQLKRLEETNRQLQEALEVQKKQNQEQQSKHTALVMSHVELEEAHAKLQERNKELKNKSEMCSVFEQGLGDMRKMLEAEVEEKQRLTDSWNQLTAFQKKYSLTWLPDKAVNNCMSCQAKFGGGIFSSGKSKGHCRFCGRIFCKECCTEQSIPEFGYNQKVKICKPCAAFRVNVLKAKAEEEAAEQDDEDDAPPMKSPPKSGGGKSAAATTKSTFSDDDDDDDLGGLPSTSSSRPTQAVGKPQKQGFGSSDKVKKIMGDDDDF